MAQLFQQSGLTLTGTQIDQFGSYYSLLQKHNDELDLTRLNRFEDIVIKHFIDCALVTRLCDLPSPLVDIGTGAGFPGIPLKIMKPDLRLILAEPRKKRAAFLAETVAALNLSNVEIYPHMVTKHSLRGRGRDYRALESVDDTLGRVAHFLPREGGDHEGARRRRGYPQNIAVTTPITKSSSTATIRYPALSSAGVSYSRRLLCAENDVSHPLTGRRNAGHFHLVAGKRDIQGDEKLISSDGIKKIGKTLVSGKKARNNNPASRPLRSAGALRRLRRNRQRHERLHRIVSA